MRHEGGDGNNDNYTQMYYKKVKTAPFTLVSLVWPIGHSYILDQVMRTKICCQTCQKHLISICKENVLLFTTKWKYWPHQRSLIDCMQMSFFYFRGSMMTNRSFCRIHSTFNDFFNFSDCQSHKKRIKCRLQRELLLPELTFTNPIASDDASMA